MISQFITRSWRRSSRHGAQLVRVHMILVRTGPVGELIFFSGRQHRFGDPRYYEWSGWDQEENAFENGRALPFDLIVGPPHPPYRSTSFFRNPRFAAAIETSRRGLEEARAENAGDGINTVDLFHPVIIVGGQMLLLNDDDSTAPLTWCRLERHRVASADPQWVDAVPESSFPETREAIFSAYGCLLQRLRCMPAVA